MPLSFQHYLKPRRYGPYSCSTVAYDRARLAKGRMVQHVHHGELRHDDWAGGDGPDPPLLSTLFLVLTIELNGTKFLTKESLDKICSQVFQNQPQLENGVSRG